MKEERVYNPLDKDHLAESIGREFFKGDIHSLPPLSGFSGAGIYALYYHGDFRLYRDIADSFKQYEKGKIESPTPIYIGKSDPPGSRKGVIDDETDEDAEAVLQNKPTHRKLYERLRKHSESIKKTTNLKIEDFKCRFMLVDEVWVSLGEARLVSWFKPLWNVLIEGFGSNTEGGGRSKTARPVWDIIHPGRKDNLGVQVDPKIESRIVGQIRAASTIEKLKSAIKSHREAKHEFRKLSKMPLDAGEDDEQT